ncbi:lytic transglycosylase domain-containing protein [Glaesserella parasuis]|uniref:lytic transglycosylase domain-containing protein n=1 Tax=Glaesserella parasuis TaxID=738 RepID=UPI0005C7406D|nr:lytic transglycosylase domain-containing protein [Glaesserella parasuis]MCT8760492.1 lytic transglycosylase domain-containing protein [Glaesserella parasuis]MCT8766570.1 lytic transglycosylase domain-containing protein [Glaesserella parasuis]MDD2170359.1 lytic transglycosylase domain-containing protein [Glaesserella parasuis]MDG6280366.1 lytic transglycosylase domain-containing protein [Glaesserella parasuis]MDG6307824.1 lytic transglycosylase domain-containing protein [Glaesserella parasui
MLRISLTILLLSLTYNANAECFNQVGKIYQIDPDYLRAIAYKESKFNTKAIGINNDGSRDIGIMQINTNNLDGLRQKFPKISIRNLLNNPCFNIHVGGYVLNENFKLYGRKWIAVGAYNAGGKNNPKRVKIRYQYALDVNHNYNAIKSGKVRLPSIKN